MSPCLPHHCPGICCCMFCTLTSYPVQDTVPHTGGSQIVMQKRGTFTGLEYLKSSHMVRPAAAPILSHLPAWLHPVTRPHQ